MTEDNWPKLRYGEGEHMEKVKSRVKGKIDPAFKVKFPGDGKEKLYAITVVVRGYNHETAKIAFGEAKLHGNYFHIAEVEETADENGEVGFAFLGN